MSSSRLRESTDAFRQVFANRGLRRLQLAFAGSDIGDWAFAVAVSVYAFQAGGADAVGILALARSAAGAAAAPFLSSLADRYRRRAVMIDADAVRLVAVLVAAVAVWSSAPAGIVYAAVIIVTVTSTAFAPAQTALLPSLTTSPEQLTAANVVTTSISGVSNFAGPALGGILLVWLGVGSVMAVDGATFVWSLALLSGIPRGEPPEQPEQRGHFLREAAAGFEAVARDPHMRVIVALYGVQVFVCGAVTVLMVVMALGPLGTGQSGVGTLNAAVGVGGIAGSLIAAALVTRGRLAVYFAAGLLGWGIPIALIAALTKTWFALAMLFLLGIGNVLVDVAGMTLLQRVAPDEVLGRVFGVLETVFSIAFGLGGVATPLLIHLTSLKATLVLVGALLPVMVVMSWPLLSRLDVGALMPERLALARGVPFLAPLPEPTLERITGLLEPITVPAGQPVFSQGDAGDRFYLIEQGDAIVERDGGEIARLAPGGYFGEIALVQDIPRTATVRAAGDLSVLALDRDEFIAAVTGHAPSRDAADAVISSRLGGVRPGLGTL
jgi:MFS family permease